MGGGSTEHVYAACRGYVVVFVLGDLVPGGIGYGPRGGHSAFYYEVSLEMGSVSGLTMVSIFDVEPLPVLLRARPVRF